MTKTMELAGSAYLYALAQVSITFAGFTALFMMLRQAIGGKSSEYDLFATRNYLGLSFLIVVGAMLPSTLAALPMRHVTAWRISGALMAIPMLLFVITYPRRRRAVTGVRLPWSIYPQQFIFTCVTLLLTSVALGVPLEPSPGPYILAVSLILFDLFYAIMLTLGMVFGAQPLGRALEREKPDSD